MPLGLNIETTNRCNFKCVMCPVSFPEWADEVGGIADMPLALHEKILADLQELGNGQKLKCLKLYGEGEPFLDPLLVEKICLSRRIAERIEVTSNGSALTAAKAKALLGSGLDYLRISVYSVRSELHHQLTGSRLLPDRIRENVSTFRRLRDEAGLSKPFLYVKMIDRCSDENREFLDLYGAIADEVMIEQPMNWNGFGGRDLIGAMYGDVPLAQIHPLGQGQRREVCAFPFYSMVIKANGDVVACCVDWNKKTKLGNVASESLADIWNGTVMREFRLMHLERRRHENEGCRNCTHLHSLPDNLDMVKSERLSR
jgi:radical SAM protein with 4Fe4S-binding SPASM domain